MGSRWKGVGRKVEWRWKGVRKELKSRVEKEGDYGFARK